ncbi:MAG: hypothetical protein ACRC0O_14645 [Vibrio metschnikovii]
MAKPFLFHEVDVVAICFIFYVKGPACALEDAGVVMMTPPRHEFLGGLGRVHPMAKIAFGEVSVYANIDRLDILKHHGAESV